MEVDNKEVGVILIFTSLHGAEHAGSLWKHDEIRVRSCLMVLLCDETFGSMLESHMLWFKKQNIHSWSWEF